MATRWFLRFINAQQPLPSFSCLGTSGALGVWRASLTLSPSPHPASSPGLLPMLLAAPTCSGLPHLLPSTPTSALRASGLRSPAPPTPNPARLPPGARRDASSGAAGARDQEKVSEQDRFPKAPPHQGHCFSGAKPTIYHFLPTLSSTSPIITTSTS